MQGINQDNQQQSDNDRADDSNVNILDSSVANKSKIGEEVKGPVHNTEPRRKSILKEHDYNDNTNIKQGSNLLNDSNNYGNEEFEYSIEGSINDDVNQSNVDMQNPSGLTPIGSVVGQPDVNMEFQINQNIQDAKVFNYQQRDIRDAQPTAIPNDSIIDLSRIEHDNIIRNIDFNATDDNQLESIIHLEDRSLIQDTSVTGIINQINGQGQDQDHNAQGTVIQQHQVQTVSQQNMFNVATLSQFQQPKTNAQSVGGFNHIQPRPMNPFNQQAFSTITQQSIQFTSNKPQASSQQLNQSSRQSVNASSLNNTTLVNSSNQPQQMQGYDSLMTLGRQPNKQRPRAEMSNGDGDDQEEFKSDRDARAFAEVQRAMGQQTKNINPRELAAFMRSKQEIYNLLLNVGQYYLPPYEECTTEYLRDIFSGKKKVLLNSEVRIVNVPRLQELSAVNLMQQVQRDAILKEYLPDVKDKKTINRDFLFNVINSVKPDFFPENIRHALKQRQEAAMMKQNKFIQITNDMYNLITKSNMWSKSTRGRALDMLNAGTKKRKQPERQNRVNDIGMNLDQFQPQLRPFSFNTTQSKRMKFNNPVTSALLGSNQMQSRSDNIINIHNASTTPTVIGDNQVTSQLGNSTLGQSQPRNDRRL